MSVFRSGSGCPGSAGFSGSTGYYYNYHRIDDLQIVQSCTF